MNTKTIYLWDELYGMRKEWEVYVLKVYATVKSENCKENVVCLEQPEKVSTLLKT